MCDCQAELIKAINIIIINVIIKYCMQYTVFPTNSDETFKAKSYQKKRNKYEVQYFKSIQLIIQLGCNFHQNSFFFS